VRGTQEYPSWPNITVSDQYLEAHDLTDPLERVNAIIWWLGLGDYTATTSAEQLAAWAQAALAPAPAPAPSPSGA